MINNVLMCWIKNYCL